MHYCISDIHGCYREFMQLLQKINLKNEDDLYIIGDCLDRGPDSVKVLEYISFHENIIPILGNHEYLFAHAAPGLFTEVTDEAINALMKGEMDLLDRYEAWEKNGGGSTMKEFRALSAEDRDFYTDFIQEFSLYETLTLNGKKYLLIHSLPDGYDGKGKLDFAMEEILFGRPEFFADWDQKTILITGHTPTQKLGPEYAGKIYHKGNFYDIDCGCVTGHRLGALCLETGEEFYVNSMSTYWTGKRRK